MITHYIMVQNVRRRIEQLRQDADAIERRMGEGAAAPTRRLVKELEGDLMISLDMVVDRETARAGKGLSDRQVRRYPHTGSGADARWKVRDLLEQYAPDTPEPEENEGQEDPETSEEDISDAVAVALRHVS